MEFRVKVDNSIDKVSDVYFADQVVLRTPALPFKLSLHTSDIFTLLENEHFMEAVLLASPVLYKECNKWKQGLLTDEKEIQRITDSLTRYYQRMYSRCTPFGLFSGCSVIKWSDGVTDIAIPNGSFNRSTRLDMHYLCALALHLSQIPALAQRLKFYPNNSRYKVCNELRYVEYNYDQGARMYKISSVADSEWLDKLFEKASDGATADELTAVFKADVSITEEEAGLFVAELINNQLLISELDPKITGDEYMHQILAVLKNVCVPGDTEMESISRLLKEIVEELHDCDKYSSGNTERYRRIIDKIKRTGVAFDEGKLFQADCFPSLQRAILNKNHQEQLLSVISVLLKLAPAASKTNLSSFAERFTSRYEDKEVPLLLALDTETGIGYTSQSGRNLSPLVEGINVAGRGATDAYDINWNKREEWLFELLLKSQNEYEIELPVDEIPSNTSVGALAPSLSVMFSLVQNDKLLFRGASGASAVNVFGRFAHGHESINSLCKATAEAEQLQNPSVIFAEIIHLPEDRVGNILQHPVFRPYEIPFLATTAVSKDFQITLQDLVVSVRDGKIRLRSKSLNKEIVPRLSNAHNYSLRSLPVYHFLADLQQQGLTNAVSFSWGSLARHFKFLPRVKIGDVILSEAVWQLQQSDMEELLASSNTSNAFREKWKMPQLVLLADGDNELLVDWESPVSVNAFTSLIRKRERIILKEFILPDTTAVIDEDDGVYCNQFVATLINKKEALRSSFYEGQLHNSNTQRGYLPGSEWVYYKIYCGSKSADEILINLISPLILQLEEKQLIDKWFFIRYIDSDFHIRLRLHLKELKNYGEVASLCLQYFQPGLENGLLWKLQADTYFRELERYGEKEILIAENIFCYDSRLKLQFFLHTEGDERENLRWQWGMRGVDELLDAMGYTLEKKYELMQFFQTSFAAEFAADSAFFKQVNSSYNSSRKSIELVMEKPVTDNNPLKSILDLYTTTNEELKEIVSSLSVNTGSSREMTDTDRWVGSYIHMNLNRLFLSEPRLHELVLYDFLCTWYRSSISRMKKSNR